MSAEFGGGTHERYSWRFRRPPVMEILKTIEKKQLLYILKMQLCLKKDMKTPTSTNTALNMKSDILDKNRKSQQKCAFYVLLTIIIILVGVIILEKFMLRLQRAQVSSQTSDNALQNHL